MLQQEFVNRLVSSRKQIYLGIVNYRFSIGLIFAILRYAFEPFL